MVAAPTKTKTDAKPPLLEALQITFGGLAGTNFATLSRLVSISCALDPALLMEIHSSLRKNYANSSAQEMDGLARPAHQSRQTRMRLSSTTGVTTGAVAGGSAQPEAVVNRKPRARPPIPLQNVFFTF